MELYLHSTTHLHGAMFYYAQRYTFMVWYLVKLRDNSHCNAVVIGYCMLQTLSSWGLLWYDAM